MAAWPALTSAFCYSLPHLSMRSQQHDFGCRLLTCLNPVLGERINCGRDRIVGLGSIIASAVQQAMMFGE